MKSESESRASWSLLLLFHRYRRPLFLFLLFIFFVSLIALYIWRRRKSGRELQKGSSSNGLIIGVVLGVLVLFGYASHILRIQYRGRRNRALELGVSMSTIQRTIVFSGATRNRDSPFAAFFLPHYHLMGQSQKEVEEMMAASPSGNDGYKDITFNLYFYEVLASILDGAAEAGKDVHMVGEEMSWDLRYFRGQPENQFTRAEITDVFPRLMDQLGILMSRQDLPDIEHQKEFLKMLREDGREDEARLLVKLARAAPGYFAEAYMKYTHPTSGSKVNLVPHSRGYDDVLVQMEDEKSTEYRERFGLDLARVVRLHSIYQSYLEVDPDSPELALTKAIRFGKTKREIPQDLDPDRITVADMEEVGGYVATHIYKFREAVALGTVEREVTRFPDDVHVLTFGAGHYAFQTDPLVAVRDGEEVQFRLKVPVGMTPPPEDSRERNERFLSSMSPARRDRLFEKLARARHTARSSLRGQRKTEGDFNRIVERLMEIHGHGIAGLPVGGNFIPFHMDYDEPGGRMDAAIGHLKDSLALHLRQFARGFNERILSGRGYTPKMDQEVAKALTAGTSRSS